MLYSIKKNSVNLVLSFQGTDVLYIVPLYFVDEWRKFIRYVCYNSDINKIIILLLLVNY